MAIIAKNPMDARQQVLDRYPDAYVRTRGKAVAIARPRTKDDKPSQVGYVSLSRLHYNESEAWQEAADLIIKVQPKDE